MKDIHSNILPVQGLVPAVRTASATGDTVDLQGFYGLEFACHVGVGGITFDGTNKLGLRMEESDNGSAWSNVDASDVLGAASVTAGVVKEFTAAKAAASVENFGYIGSKRYVRMSPVFSGTHGTGTAIGIVAIKAAPMYAPAQ